MGLHLSAACTVAVAVVTACVSREDPTMPSHRDRALSPGGFTRLGKPRPGDWLSEHPERGQSFEQFVASRPNRPTAERRTIYLVALGSAGSETRDLVPKMVDYAGRFFAMPARVLPTIVLEDAEVTERKNPHTGQRQLLTSDILGALRKRLPDDAYCLIAFTDVDLYPAPTWNFVFGQASFVDRVGVYSMARYQWHRSAGPRRWPRTRCARGLR